MYMYIFLRKIKKFNRERGQGGMAIYLALVTLSIVLSIALGVGALVSGRLKMLNEAGASVTAFAAAETGIEWSLLNVTGPSQTGAATFSNGAGYSVQSSMCGAANEFLCVTSIGTYHSARRAIRVQQ